jgi:hypothetical protein
MKIIVKSSEKYHKIEFDNIAFNIYNHQQILALWRFANANAIANARF